MRRGLLTWFSWAFICLTVNAEVLSTPLPSQNNVSNVDTTVSPTVRFHAWGGSAQVNGYIRWLAKQLAQKHNIVLQHVKLADTSDAVARVLAEKAAGNSSEGSVDLIWINGENFATMKKHGLLTPNWVHELPSFALTSPN